MWFNKLKILFFLHDYCIAGWTGLQRNSLLLVNALWPMNTMISILAIDVVAIHIIEMFSDIVCTVPHCVHGTACDFQLDKNLIARFACHGVCLFSFLGNWYFLLWVWAVLYAAIMAVHQVEISAQVDCYLLCKIGWHCFLELAKHCDRCCAWWWSLIIWSRFPLILL